jgi:hypothetical protein
MLLGKSSKNDSSTNDAPVSRTTAHKIVQPMTKRSIIGGRVCELQACIHSNLVTMYKRKLSAATACCVIE